MTDSYIVRAHAQAAAYILNQQQRKAVNNAILRAKEQPDAFVSMVDPHTGRVQSSHSAEDGNAAVYTVQLPHSGGDAITCTCQAGHMKKMCWHVAKVMLLKGASIKVLLLHLWLYAGTSKGGYQQLQKAMAAEAATPSDSSPQGQASAQQLDEGGVEEQESEAGGEGAHLEQDSDGDGARPSAAAARPEAEERPVAAARRSRQDRAAAASAGLQAALDIISGQTESWPADAPEWDKLTLILNVCRSDAERYVRNVGAAPLERSSSLPAFQVEARDETDNPLKRRRDWLERAASRRVSRQAPVQQPSAYPFLPSAATPRPATEREAIRAKMKELGVQAAAGPPAAADTPSMPRSCSAPQLSEEPAQAHQQVSQLAAVRKAVPMSSRQQRQRDQPSRFKEEAASGSQGSKCTTSSGRLLRKPSRLD